jgi:hypothetical protein
MKRAALCVFAGGLLMTGTALAQMETNYLDLYIAKVKPEKRAEFDAIAKKIMDANHRYKGDHWLAYQAEYGEQNTVYFSSPRKNYEAIDQAFGAFMQALNEAYTPTGAKKLFQEMNNCLASSRGEVRRMRWDLSFNPPADPEALAKLIGEARWFRIHSVRVVPARLIEFEDQVRQVKAALEKANTKLTTLVSQSELGQQGMVFYFSSPRASLGAFDSSAPLRQLLGEEGYRAFMKGVGENTLSSETDLYRILPQLSNPPEQIASVAPDFWTPKPVATAAKRRVKAPPAVSAP